jgi:hypothetical protein
MNQSYHTFYYSLLAYVILYLFNKSTNILQQNCRFKDQFGKASKISTLTQIEVVRYFDVMKMMK